MIEYHAGYNLFPGLGAQIILASTLSSCNDHVRIYYRHDQPTFRTLLKLAKVDNVEFVVNEASPVNNHEHFRLTDFSKFFSPYIKIENKKKVKEKRINEKIKSFAGYLFSH